jgi:hypothetical protein
MRSLILASSFLFLLLGGNVFADEVIVKKSKTSICHAPGTTYYKQTKYYKAYKTLRECLESGGRLPRK